MPFGLDFFHDSENQVNLFFSRCSRSSLAPDFSKAGAKVRTFSEPPKLFRENFRLLCKNSFSLDKSQGTKLSTPYYIIYKAAISIKGSRSRGQLVNTSCISTFLRIGQKRCKSLYVPRSDRSEVVSPARCLWRTGRN